MECWYYPELLFGGRLTCWVTEREGVGKKQRDKTEREKEREAERNRETERDKERLL